MGNEQLRTRVDDQREGGDLWGARRLDDLVKIVLEPRTAGLSSFGKAVRLVSLIRTLVGVVYEQ